ncbi:MAG TPA: glycosyltransferase family 2 protein [Candidatus Chromulinivoraceae bacterium]|nr:glycosyltransferase family 2 protein [Candidatus Chromulinivoraceae bacterium]
MNNKSIERIAVVVLNYKAPNDTVACVESLLKQSLSNFMIVLVENGSQDNSADVLETLKKKHSSRVTLLLNKKNLGFTGGVNAGISWSRDNNYDYVALLNNDALADPKWLETLLLRARSDKSLGIVTSLLLHADGKTIDSTGEQYSIWGLSFPRGRGKKAMTAPEGGLVFGATGGASLYRTALFDDIGIFDNAFFAYYEDVDLSFRAQLRGWKVYYEPKATAYHKQGATSSKMPGFTVYQTFKNLPIVYTKNVPRPLLISVGIRFWFAYIIILLNAIKNGNAQPALKGFFKGIVLFWSHAIPARFAIQSRKTAKTTYIKELLWPDLPPDQKGLRALRKFFTGK